MKAINFELLIFCLERRVDKTHRTKLSLWPRNSDYCSNQLAPNLGEDVIPITPNGSPTSRHHLKSQYFGVFGAWHVVASSKWLQNLAPFWDAMQIFNLHNLYLTPFQHLEELPDQLEVLRSKICCPVTFLLMPASTNKWPKRFPKASLVAGQRPLKKRSNSHGPLRIVFLLSLLDMLVDTCFVTVQYNWSNVQHVPGTCINAFSVGLRSL